MRMVVRTRGEPYDLTRVEHSSDGRFGENSRDESTINGVTLFLFRPTEVNVDTEHGDRLEGDLQGLALPSADVKVDDEVDHGGETYVVTEIRHIPSNEDRVLKLFSLDRVVN